MNVSELPSLTSTEGRSLDVWSKNPKQYPDEKFPFNAGEIKGNRWYCGCKFHGFAPSGKTWKCRISKHEYLSDCHTPGIGFDALCAAWWSVCKHCGRVR